MSQWGKLDYSRLVGTAAAVTGLANVTFSTGSITTANIRPGDALLISNVKYRVASLDSNTTLTLSNVFTNGTGGGLVAAVQQSPKDLLTYGQTSNVNYTNLVGKRNVFGVDRTEAALAANKANGISHTGWVHYKTWTNSQGTTRHRAEVLVAMSKNFNANALGTLQIDADFSDNVALQNA